jgi:hypothetical protein
MSESADSAKAHGGGANWWQLVTREAMILVFLGLSLVLGALALDRSRQEEQAGQEPAKPESESIWLHGLRDFGFSLMEAGLVIALIEVRSAREQVKRSAELVENATRVAMAWIEKSSASLFSSVYKQRVPNELVALYEETAFRCPLFRIGHEYTCTFEESGEATAEMIPATFYQRFFMRNLTESDVAYELVCETQLPPTQAEKCKFTRLDIDGKQVQITPEMLSLVERVGYKALRLSRTENIKPGDKGTEFEIWFENLRHRRDFEVVAMNWPADGILFEVIHPKSFEIQLNALHPGDLREVTTSRTSKKWRLTAGFLVGQGVCLSWRDKNSNHEVGEQP